MKQACLFLTTLLATTSTRRLFVTAACSGYDDSFYFDASGTVLDATLSGCYAVAPDGAEANSVRVFTVNGDEQAEGDLVFFASGSVTDDNLVWAVGVYGAEDDSHSKLCYDQNFQEVAEMHPSAVTSWICLDDDSEEYEIEVQSTCHCITISPSSSPTTLSPSPSPVIFSPSPSTTNLSPTPPPTSRPTPAPTPTPTSRPTPTPTPTPTSRPTPIPTPTPTSDPTPTAAPTRAPAVPTPAPTLTPIQAPVSASEQGKRDSWHIW
ncbi:unnamed protein product [Ectocarpus sp. 12 AP-2014]